MAEARGLSRAVIQSPDIIGEQREAEALRGQQALQREKFAASQVPKPFKLDSDSKLNQLPAEFNTADLKFSEAVTNFINKNAVELSKGNPYYTGKLRSFIDKYNAVKKQADLSTSQFRGDVEELSEEQRDVFGFTGYLADAEDLGRNLVIGDDLSIRYSTPDGELDVLDANVLHSPRSYYYKPISWLDLATKGAVATKNSIERDGRTVTEKDNNLIRTQISNTIDHNLKSNPDALASMINEYSNNVLGTQLSPDAINDIITGTGITASTLDGEKRITLDEITNWAKNVASEQVGAKVGVTVREDSDRGDFVINFNNQDDLNKLKGRVFTGGVADDKNALVYNPRDVNLRTTVEMETKSGDLQDFKVDAQLDKIRVNPNGEIRAEISYFPSSGVRGGSTVKILSPESSEIAQIEKSLKIPEGSFMEYYRAKINEAPEEPETSGKIEEMEESYTFGGETYTISELKTKYGDDFNPSDYEGFELKK